MSWLTDTNLEEIVLKNPQDDLSDDKITIYPYNESSVTPVGYDLRIGSEYSKSTRAKKFYLKENEEFTIKPGETVFIKILEKIIMPRNKKYSGMVVSKVSVTGKGLINSTTTIDPDWTGNLLLVMHNLSHNDLILRHNQEICTAIFFENKSPSKRPCAKNDGRNEILVNNWNELNIKANKIEIMNRIISPSIVIISFFVGNYFFGNTTALSASVACGVALSQLLNKRRG